MATSVEYWNSDYPRIRNEGSPLLRGDLILSLYGDNFDPSFPREVQTFIGAGGEIKPIDRETTKVVINLQR